MQLTDLLDGERWDPFSTGSGRSPHGPSNVLMEDGARPFASRTQRFDQTSDTDEAGTGVGG